MKKTQELDELRAKDKKALFANLEEAQRKLVALRFGAALRKLKNYREIKKERQRIARIWTVLAEKSLTEIDKVAK